MLKLVESGLDISRYKEVYGAVEGFPLEGDSALEGAVPVG